MSNTPRQLAAVIATAGLAVATVAPAAVASKHSGKPSHPANKHATGKHAGGKHKHHSKPAAQSVLTLAQAQALAMRDAGFFRTNGGDQFTLIGCSATPTGGYSCTVQLNPYRSSSVCTIVVDAELVSGQPQVADVQSSCQG